jgi:5-methyltetrahydropteroyltriglutamate--homocysteine methyltransferase
MSKPLLTTTIGSFPKPEYLQKARNAASAGKLSVDELQDLERKATKEVIELQEELGIDLLVDGEMARGDMVAYFAENLEGMELGGLVRSYGNRYYHKPVIKDRVRWTRPITLDYYNLAQSLTDKPVKGMLTAPYTIVEWSFIEGYDTRRDAVLAMADVVHQEALELERAGATYIQIDEPALHTRPEEDLDTAIEAMNIVTDGLKATSIVHVCYGELGEVYPRMLDMNVDEFNLALCNVDYQWLDLFKKDKFTKVLGAGVFDVHSHRVPTVEEVKGGIKKVLEILPPDQVVINPDCGLKTRTWDEAADQLRVMVQATREVKQELGLE